MNTSYDSISNLISLIKLITLEMVTKEKDKNINFIFIQYIE